jgi:hypothetical protein
MFLTIKSKNKKLGFASSTYAPIAQTCSARCPLRDNGCYAQGGRVGLHEKHLREWNEDLNGDTIAMLEASEIESGAKRVKGNRALRLHVSGDANTVFRARVLAQACESWRGQVWSYTHSWRDVPREAWGNKVSILASCERLDDAKAAMAKGYAAALVTGPHPADGRAYERDGVKVIPCPSQTRDVKCTDCRLCFDAPGLLARNAVIAFETHGVGKKRALAVIQ